MKKLLHYIFLGLAVNMAAVINAQVSVNFSPVVYGQSLDGLAYAQLISTYADNLTAVLTIKIRTSSGDDVVTVKTPVFPIQPGVNAISKRIFSLSKFSFADNNYGVTLSQTNRFPEGDYEYCFEVDMSFSKLLQTPPVFENCFSHSLQPLTPLLLIDPADEDEICNKRPNFLWQPPMPLSRDARFRIIVTEVKEKQDIAEAIAYNIPVINRGNLSGNNLFFPPNLAELKEGHKYVWQVTVYDNRTILKKSEIWEFTVKCEEKPVPATGDSYREVKETDDGNFYIAGKALSFSFNNPYNSGDLNYSIVSLSNPGEVIKGLPALKMNAGLNKYDIMLSDNNGFKTGKEYLLKITLTNNRELKLRFIYKNE